MRALLWIAPTLLATQAAGAAPENLARRATVSASSQYDHGGIQLLARHAVDGVIPELLDRNDYGHSWALYGAEAGGKGTFTLEWETPVRVAEIIYYARASWLLEECFRDYEVLVDNRPEPVARGTFEMNAGPQRIPVAPVEVRKLTLRFLSSYGGVNAGAAEIEVYAESPPDEALPQLKHLPRNVALKATVSASSEYSESYTARGVVDGAIPAAFSGNDAGHAWATRGAHAAELSFTWDRPVTVCDLVYYGRTAILVEECMREYEVTLDDGPEPVARGEFQLGAGPQVVSVGPRAARKVTLRFRSSYGGPNPGAAEVQVYDEPAPLDMLPKFLKDGWDAPKEDAGLTRVVAEGRLGFDRLLVAKRYELNPSHVYTASCEGFQPGGGLYVLSPPTPDGQLVELVASPEGQIMDCDVSWDGSQVIFSWRRTPQDGYHIYRINADGSGLTQLTDGAWHDYNACWLPDGGIAFISTRAQVFALCFVTPSGVLYRMDAEGGNVTKLSANYVNDFTPSVLPDGRILYSRWEYVDKPAIPIQSLWTINPDGTGLSVFYGNRVLSPATFVEARAMPGTSRVLTTLTAHNGPIRGGVGVIEREWGVNAQRAITNLTPNIDIGRVDQGSGNHVQGPFEGPVPIDGERFLVSGKGSIYLGTLEGQWALVKARDGQLGLYNPVPLRPRERPPVMETARPKATAEAKATVFLLDVYRGLEPQVQRGQVKQIAVIEELAKPVRTAVLGFGFQRPVISCGATYAPKRVWGYVPVEADGSAYFTVPADRPLYFEALDEHGQALQRMRSFTHLQPGESQGCIGCHEPRESTPPVAAPLALKRAPSELEPPEWGVGGFDYVQVVQPVLDAHCVKCHSGPTPPKGVDLSGDKTDWFNVSYDVLTRGYVSWIDTRNGNEANILQVDPLAWGSPASRLTPVLLSGHPDVDGKPRVRLSPAEVRRVLAWMDLNVPYYSTYEMSDESLEGGRRVYPLELDAKLAEIAARRCAACHTGSVRRVDYLRITRPELNDFLAAPLAKSAGGRGSCGGEVFRSAEDPDYVALLEAVRPAHRALVEKPRMDMPGAVAAEVSRSCM
ncbi:MAG: hypothetical protein FJX74_14800 [Armatimonadetes bacterium]|nr:hypothetical protein [Armatimonadota bacterium]